MGIQVIGGATGGGAEAPITIRISDLADLGVDVDFELSLEADAVEVRWYPDVYSSGGSEAFIAFYGANYVPLVGSKIDTYLSTPNYPEPTYVFNLAAPVQYVSIKSGVAGQFTITKITNASAIKYTDIAAGTLTTLTETDPAYVLAADSYIAVIGGGGAGGASYGGGPAAGGGSGHIAVGFKPAGTYAVVIGAGGLGAANAAQLNTAAGAIGGTSSFDDIEAPGGNQTFDEVSAMAWGGSAGGSYSAGGFFGNGVNGQPNGGSRRPPAMWVPYATSGGTSASTTGNGGGVYAGGGSPTATNSNGSGGNAAANTGGGGGGARSTLGPNGTSQQGGNGGSGVIYIWTPA